jgi:hypothetical protein
LAVFSALVARHAVLHQLVIHARPIRSQHPRLLVTPHPGGIPAGQRPSGDPSDAMPGSLQPDDEPGKVAGRQTSPAPVEHRSVSAICMQRDVAAVFARLITERTAMPTADDHADMVSVDTR